MVLGSDLLANMSLSPAFRSVSCRDHPMGRLFTGQPRFPRQPAVLLQPLACGLPRKDTGQLQETRSAASLVN